MIPLTPDGKLDIPAFREYSKQKSKEYIENIRALRAAGELPPDPVFRSRRVSVEADPDDSDYMSPADLEYLNQQRAAKMMGGFIQVCKSDEARAQAKQSFDIAKENMRLLEPHITYKRKNSADKLFGE